MDKGKNLLIYVVEDNTIYNRILCEYLKNQKYLNVKAFTSGKDCIQSVRNGEHPDIVIQDYQLEDLTGIEVLHAVKKISKFSEFVFLTANENMEVAVESIKSGAFDYIIKDNDIALKKVIDKITKIAKIKQLKQNNKATKLLMIILLLILIVIIVSGMLLFAFGVIKVK